MDIGDKKILFSCMNDYQQQDIVDEFAKFAFLGYLVAVAKGIKYQNSFCKRGMFSISQNLERKWDRMENMIFSFDLENMGLGGSDSLIDTMMDMSNYNLLGISFLSLRGTKDNIPVFKSGIESSISSMISYLENHLPQQNLVNLLQGFNRMSEQFSLIDERKLLISKLKKEMLNEEDKGA